MPLAILHFAILSHDKRQILIDFLKTLETGLPTLLAVSSLTKCENLATANRKLPAV